MENSVVERLLGSSEASLRYKVLVGVQGSDPQSENIRQLQAEIKTSLRVQALLSERDEQGRLPHHPYHKWLGAHWVLALLADLGYPAGDAALVPLREQVLGWLLSAEHAEFIRKKSSQGRVRACASIEGNALYAMLTLGIADGRSDDLAQRLMQWQWPDGGWNCDKKPEASHSSFMESLIPMRALNVYARQAGSPQARLAVERAAEIFLKRSLFKRQRDGRVISPDFLRLHYPCYWHYDILFGLKVLAEAGFIGDARCQEALDLLESRRLPDGGFPADACYYRLTDKKISGRSLVNWGGTSKKRMNEFVTADALVMLKAAGRLG